MRIRTRRRRLGMQALERRDLLAAQISELLVDPLFGNPDTDQMVELRGEPNSQLADGTYLLVVSERGLDEGKIHGVFDLSGQSFGTSGYLVLLQKDSPHQPLSGANVLQSTGTAFSALPGGIYSDTHPLSDRIDFIIGANAYLLVQTAITPVLGTDIDVENDGVIDPVFATQWDILDSISLHSFVGRGDIAYGSIVFAEIGSASYEISIPGVVEIVFTEGFGYAGRRGESVGSAAKDWIAGTVQDETRTDNNLPPRWALVDNLFGVPSQYPFSGRDLDHVGAANFVGGVRGTVSTQVAETSVSGVTVLADTNSNGIRDLLTFVVDPDDVIDHQNPLDENGKEKVYPLINAFPGVTITNYALDEFPASAVTAEKESDFPNTLENRIFATGGIDWFDSSGVLRFDFYRPVNSVSIEAIGSDNPLSYVYGRIDAYNESDELIASQRSSRLVDSQRETISIIREQDEIAYAYAYSDDDYLDGGPFGRFDRMVYTQLEPAAVTDDQGFYEIESLFPSQYQLSLLGGYLAGSPQPISVDTYENFVVDFEITPNRPPIVEGMEFQINENSASGSPVGMLSASDPDAQAVRFQLAEPGNHGFVIDETTGEIAVGPEAVLDFESSPQYQFDVLVRDPLNAVSRATVKVNILDVNEAPSVTPETLSIAESAAQGTQVGSVSASDPDTALNQTLTYEIIGGTGQQVFQIHSDTGVMTLASGAELDHESVPEFSVEVRVSDGGTPNLQDVATIVIQVTDVNERPEVTASTFRISESASDGAVVGNVSATDPDAEQRLRYSVTGGSGEGHFDVDPQTGRITVSSGVDLDFEASPQWSLLVLVRDDGDPSLSTTAEQVIHVDDEDEAPQFVSELSLPAVETGAMLEWLIPVDAILDPEGDASSLDAEGLPPWLTFDPLTRAFTGIPSSFFAGASEFVLKATQVGAPDLSDSVTVTLTVTISDTPLHNLVVTHDVNGDSDVTANDALRIINYLAREGSDKLVDATFRFDGFFDVTGDNRVTSLDALRVINEMARRELSGSGEEIALGTSSAEFDELDVHDLGLRRYLDNAGLF